MSLYTKTYTTDPREAEEYSNPEAGRYDTIIGYFYDSPLQYIHPFEMYHALERIAAKATLIQQYDRFFRQIVDPYEPLEWESLDPDAPLQSRPGSDFLFQGVFIRFRDWTLLGARGWASKRIPMSRNFSAQNLEIISETKEILEKVFSELELP